MKKSLILLLSLLVGSAAFAQKSNINVNELYFNYKYRTEPSQPRDPLFFDYAVNVAATAAVQEIYSLDALKEKLYIAGQHRVDSLPGGKGMFINADLRQGLMIMSSMPAQSGSEFSMNIKYRFSPKISVSCDGETLFTVGGSRSGEPVPERTFQTKAFKTSKEASDFWNNNMALIKNQIIVKELDDALSTASTTASERYGFAVVDYRGFIHVKTAKVGSHPESADIDKMAQSLKTKFGKLNGSVPLTEQGLAKEIAYFKALPERFTSTDPKNKADQKIRFLAYYNLCQIYYLMDRPEELVVWAEKLIANDQNPKEGERFKGRADKMVAELNKSTFKSSQFDPQNMRQ